MAGEASDSDTGLTVEQAASAFDSILFGGQDTQQGGEGDEHGAGEGDSLAGGEEHDALGEGDDLDGKGEGHGDEEDEGGGQPAKVRVTVNGKEVEVSQDELIAAYVARSDSSQQAPELEQQRQAVEAERQQVSRERMEYANRLQQLHGILGQMMPKEPDWARLRAEDPQAYAVQWADWQATQAQRAALEAEYARVQEAHMAEQVAALQTHVKSEWQEALKLIPEWRDEAKAKADQTALYQYGKEQGFADHELRSVFNARQVNVLRKAMLYDRLQVRKTELRQGNAPAGPAAVRPGVSQSGTPASAVTRAKQRLAKTGSVKDAAAVFENLI